MLTKFNSIDPLDLFSRTYSSNQGRSSDDTEISIHVDVDEAQRSENVLGLNSSIIGQLHGIKLRELHHAAGGYGFRRSSRSLGRVTVPEDEDMVFGLESKASLRLVSEQDLDSHLEMGLLE